jgi:hypothetical protein
MVSSGLNVKSATGSEIEPFQLELYREVRFNEDLGSGVSTIIDNALSRAQKSTEREGWIWVKRQK